MNFEGYAHYYNLINKYKQYKKEAKFVYKWADRPKTILELGIGTGQHAKYLADKAKIIGLDQSMQMLANAYKHKNINYYCGSIEKRILKTFKKVDCVMALFNVTGYVPLFNILPHLQLKDNGYFIFDCWDKQNMTQEKAVPKLDKLDTDCYRISIPSKVTDRSIIITFIIVDKNKMTVNENHYINIYSQSDIIKMANLYGYEIVSMHNSGRWTMWYKLRKK